MPGELMSRMYCSTNRSSAGQAAAYRSEAPGVAASVARNTPMPASEAPHAPACNRSLRVIVIANTPADRGWAATLQANGSKFPRLVACRGATGLPDTRIAAGSEAPLRGGEEGHARCNLADDNAGAIGGNAG